VISIEDIASGKFALNMIGPDMNWSARVDRLRTILRLAAPKKTAEPMYSFSNYYYCEDGYWYESSWNRKEMAVSVFYVNF